MMVKMLTLMMEIMIKFEDDGMRIMMIMITMIFWMMMMMIMFLMIILINVNADSIRI